MLRLLRSRTKKKNTTPKIVPMFQDLYDQVNKMDLHRNRGLHGKDEVFSMIEELQENELIKIIANNGGRKFVQPLSHNQNLFLDERGKFYELLLRHFMPGDSLDERKYDIQGIIDTYHPGTLTASTLKDGMLDYIRYAPWKDAWTVCKGSRASNI